MTVLVWLVVGGALVAGWFVAWATRWVNRADDQRTAVLDENAVFVVGEGKSARLAARTPDGELYEQRGRRGSWGLVTPAREVSA